MPNNEETATTVKLEDFKDVPKIPCARNAMLYGMGAGTGVGAVRYLMKQRIPTAANWAVAVFCGVSAVSFELCQMARKQKLEKLQLIIKATDSRPIPSNERVTIDERGRNGAFHVMVDLPETKKD
ncbi:hypothetical protein PHYBLDRAFT_151404 [Phycomyces blakesleeanus NRRL 1555(-)]|uniref:Cytochrome c oxidase assembly protein COX20, mitochondrial n=1 Tax=Phycomyces blakesleeanus (strain ATCC 8743b / DSM 1359 / FGSC 10004 / NBRC 33097 / NRRL 1555) TaxID=763407 RepID=A0A167K8S8_PHYB8|nr:hypothetical protein PHYBLDRAFT_151404 [Phycomyces blakesleeanus NRRL 1555(-)]OAD67496.1 hypothetical protein PHYBLDRAFT_151404 [Phycomyces blakesleeanus NRRL 1555(-)]|eukprot:XP_018285536.1 hypothetical protein PHYBLDRAFT_151404 [Phycomyces blakesleeanus NRRL 1555(-)]